MGDVVTALGRAVQEEGHRVEVILPKYDCIRYDDVSFPPSFQCLMPLQPEMLTCEHMQWIHS